MARGLAILACASLLAAYASGERARLCGRLSERLVEVQAEKSFGDDVEFSKLLKIAVDSNKIPYKYIEGYTKPEIVEIPGLEKNAKDVMAPCTKGRGVEVDMAKTLGEGFYGSVFPGWNGSLHVAVKMITAEDDQTQDELVKAVSTEVAAQRVAAFYGLAPAVHSSWFCSAPDRGVHHAFIVMDFVPGRTLLQQLKQMSPQEKEALEKAGDTKTHRGWLIPGSVASRLAVGLGLLNALGQVTTDMKFVNIMLTDEAPGLQFIDFAFPLGAVQSKVTFRPVEFREAEGPDVFQHWLDTFDWTQGLALNSGADSDWERIQRWSSRWAAAE